MLSSRSKTCNALAPFQSCITMQGLSRTLVVLIKDNQGSKRSKVLKNLNALLSTNNVTWSCCFSFEIPDPKKLHATSLSLLWHEDDAKSDKLAHSNRAWR